MEHQVSSETCSQISSADSTYARSGKKDEEADSSMDEGASLQSDASAEERMSISGQYSILRLDQSLQMALQRKREWQGERARSGSRY